MRAVEIPGRAAAIGFVTAEHIAAAARALPVHGCYLMEAAYPPAVCDRVRGWMDAAGASDKAEINYGGSETRVWGAAQLNDDVREFTARSDEFLTRMLGRPQRAHTTLAIRNLPIDLNDPATIRGRWHIDSFRRQYKLFLFLSDVNEASGPFELIPDTQHTPFKLRMAASGRYFGLGGALKGQRAYSKLADELIAKLFERGFAASPVVCPAGTVMVVDTSAIHRARPCVSQPRYALTTYFR